VLQCKKREYFQSQLLVLEPRNIDETNGKPQFTIGYKFPVILFAAQWSRRRAKVAVYACRRRGWHKAEYGLINQNNIFFSQDD
jgi:hypothetical protein